MNLCRGSSIISLALLVMLCATSAFAEVPLVTSYQGRLLDGADKPLSGSYTMVFQIYNAPVGGALLWTEDHVGVLVADGLFSVALGATVPLSAELLAGNGGGGGGIGRYLQIQVAGQPPISPRTPLTASPMSVASSSVSGDVVTAPGALHMFDADSASTIDMGTELIAGKKVAKFKAGAELAGSVNKREVAVSAADDSASIAIDEQGVHRMVVSSSGGSGGSGGQVSLRVSNTCCLGSSGEDGVGLVSDESSNSISVVRLNGLPPGTPVTGKVVMSATNDSSSVVVGDPNIASVVSSVGNLAGGAGGGAAAASYAATGRMTPSGLDQVMTRVDESGPSIAIDESGVHVARMAADNDSTYSELSGRRPGRVKYGDVHISSDATRSSLHVKFQDGDIPTGQDRFVSVSADSAAGTILLEADTDGDGVMDNSVSSSSSSTGAKHAINTKGTGGTTGRTVRATTDSLVAASSVEADLDGDDVAENSVASGADATGSRMAIKTKGTGAEANKSASLTVTGSPGGSAISAVCATDIDGDGTPENFSSQVCNADSVYREVSVTAPQPGGFVALMKVKEKANRTKCSSSLRYSAPSSASGKDDDCDGFSASRSLFFDNDGDGLPENGIQEVCLPTSCSMAIKTKGTGADKNRAASFACVADVDGDGTVDRQVSTTADSTTAGIAIDEPGVQIAMDARKGWDGTIKGRIAIDESGAHRVLFDSDGNGFFASKVGIGVDAPTHSVDVAGGAYCDGTNWVNASDANVKENFQPVNGSELLDQIEQLAISKWNYKGDAGMAHIGPTAQDFQAAFGVGSDGKSISTIDPAGIALAAAKELCIELKDKTQQINDLQSKLLQLQALVEKLLAEKK